MAAGEPMSPRDILDKVMSEGGWEAAFEWGLKPDHSDDPEIKGWIQTALEWYVGFTETTRILEGALEAKAGPELVRDEC